MRIDRSHELAAKRAYEDVCEVLVSNTLCLVGAAYIESRYLMCLYAIDDCNVRYSWRKLSFVVVLSYI